MAIENSDCSNTPSGRLCFYTISNPTMDEQGLLQLEPQQAKALKPWPRPRHTQGRHGGSCGYGVA